MQKYDNFLYNKGYRDLPLQNSSFHVLQKGFKIHCKSTTYLTKTQQDLSKCLQSNRGHYLSKSIWAIFIIESTQTNFFYPFTPTFGATHFKQKQQQKTTTTTLLRISSSCISLSCCQSLNIHGLFSCFIHTVILCTGLVSTTLDETGIPMASSGAANKILTLLISPSLLGKASTTLAKFQWPLGALSSFNMTISPTITLRTGDFHFLRGCKDAKYSGRQRSQNSSASRWTHLHLFLA